MIEKEDVFKADDGKKYYVMDSIIYENSNYIMIGEVSDSGDNIVGGGIIMLNNNETGMMDKVTDPKLMVKLAVEFGNKEGIFDFE